MLVAVKTASHLLMTTDNQSKPLRAVFVVISTDLCVCLCVCSSVCPFASYYFTIPNSCQQQKLSTVI